MTKPLGATGLTVDSDLTESGYNQAHHQIVEIKAENGDFGNDSDKEFFSGYRVLRVASQNMGEAIMLRVHNAFYIEPSFSYLPDEWSLHDKAWNKETKKYDEIIIWSPGA